MVTVSDTVGCTDVGEQRLHPAARDRGQQCGGTVERAHRESGVHHTFVATARLTGQPVTARGAEHGERAPDGRLEQDVGGLVAHLGGRATHDTGQRDHAGLVRNDDVLRVEGAHGVVEGAERLPRLGPADHQPARQRGGVERVEWLAQLEHDVVGDVDRGRDGSHPGQQQPSLDRPGGHRGRIDAHDAARGETGGTRLGTDVDGPRLALGGGRGHDWLRGVGGIDEAQVETARQFAAETAHAQGVTAIGRHIDVEHGVVHAQNGECVVAGLGRADRQHENAGVIRTETELGHRADHAVGRAPVRGPRGDGEPAGQNTAGKCGHDEVALREVPCTANDSAGLSLAHLDQAEADRLLELGQLLDGLHTADDQRARDLRKGDDVLDLEADGHEPRVELVSSDAPLRSGLPDDLGQPGLGHSHDFSTLSV